MNRSTPQVVDIRAHYDLPDEFFALFLDPTMTYTCAYFPQPGMSLEEAQRAKFDLAFGKLNLAPGMTVLDLTAAWGSALAYAVTECDVNVHGLTQSRRQYDYARKVVGELAAPRSADVAHLDWDHAEVPVDGILAIGSLEHVRRERYDEFFAHAHSLLPDGGRMLLQTVIGFDTAALHDRGLPADHEHELFGTFLRTEVFPGAQAPQSNWVHNAVEAAGFRVEHVHSLRTDFARTLDMWAANLMNNRDAAIRVASADAYQRYLRYLTGCAERFRRGYFDQVQYTLVK